ncbi:Glutathione S-transferase domain protein [hydrothermal vent metagenome]|uniref:Glutathione S-transferase domain protein n=1 Tax=hydrothermal vent metagenome TaxID=652676 RepID=A0A3B0XF07_9ZZZZ
MHSLQLPILYTFRRCPYAIRARLAIRYSQLQVELREIELKNKPAELLQASAKATVPVLILNEQTVIDESLDIMHWSLHQYDPENWLQTSHNKKINFLIQHNDAQFKIDLDHYKYADRFPLHAPHYYRQQGERFLIQLEKRLNQHQFLINHCVSIADIALFPFIRQFAYVDIKWFETSPYPKLRSWLSYWLESELFLSIMKKHPVWQSSTKNKPHPIIF